MILVSKKKCHKTVNKSQSISNTGIYPFGEGPQAAV